VLTLIALGLSLVAQSPAVLPDALTAGAKGRPTLVHFVQVDCVCSLRAAPQVERLRTAFGERVHFVAVLDAPAPAAQAWVKSAGLGFTVVADAKAEQLAARDVTRSLTTILYNPQGREVQRWRGHSAAHLKATAEATSTLLGIPAVSLSLDEVPTELVAGCTFPSR